MSQSNRPSGSRRHGLFGGSSRRHHLGHGSSSSQDPPPASQSNISLNSESGVAEPPMANTPNSPGPSLTGSNPPHQPDQSQTSGSGQSRPAALPGTRTTALPNITPLPAHDSIPELEPETMTITETTRTVTEPVSVKTEVHRKVISSRTEVSTTRNQTHSTHSRLAAGSSNIVLDDELPRDSSSPASSPASPPRTPPETPPAQQEETPLTTPPTASPTPQQFNLGSSSPTLSPDTQTSSTINHEYSQTTTADSSNAAMAISETADFHFHSVTHNQTNSYLTDTDNFIRQHVFKYGGSFAETKAITGLEVYLTHIAEERILRMPTPGSDWDRILQAAQFFGLQLSGLGCTVADVDGDVKTATVKALTTLQTLLLLGLFRSRTLLPTFQVFYQLSAKISNIRRVPDTSQARHELATLFRAVVRLIEAVANTYEGKLGSLVEDSSVTIRFDQEFGDIMKDIFQAEQDIFIRMWILQQKDLGDDEARRSVDDVYRQLKPSWGGVNAFYERVYASLERHGATCEWFDLHLEDYLVGGRKSLVITGPPGMGKTVLAGWIEERLHRSLDSGEYTALMHSLPFDGGHEDCTQTAVLKAILLQLFNMRAGDWGVYNKLCDALKTHDVSSDAAALEAPLWEALKGAITALNSDKRKVVMVIDGIDRIAIDGQNCDARFFKTFLQLIDESESCHLITMSQGLPIGATKESEFAIPEDEVRYDIESYLRDSLSKFPVSLQPSEADVDTLVSALVEKGSTTFLWAHLVIRLLAKSSSSTHLQQTVKGLDGTVDHVTKRLVTQDFMQDPISRKALSFMLAADRPLTIQEASEFVGIDIDHGGHKPFGDLNEHLQANYSEIVLIRHGALHFRSKSIRSRVQSLMGKLELIHGDVAKALLVYTGTILGYKDSPGPSLNLNAHEIVGLLDAFPLLHYAVANWQTHHRASGLGDEVLSQVLPRCYRFALVQLSLWHKRSRSTLLADFLWFLNVQRTCFKDTNDSGFILQTVAILANLHNNSDRSEYLKAADFWYQAACYAESPDSRVDAYGAFFMKCANSYLECIVLHLKVQSTVDQAFLTEVNLRKEKMIRLLINISITIYGPSSEQVLEWYERLVYLYVHLKKFSEITKLTKDVCPEGPGKKELHKRLVRRIYDVVVQFRVKLQGNDEVAGPARESYSDLFGEIHALLDDKALKDTVDFHLDMGSFYERHKKWDHAEKTYVNLWIRTRTRFEASPTPQLELQRDTLRVGFQYARFIGSQGYGQEAADILAQLWESHTRYTWSDKAIVDFWRKIGYLLKSLDRLDVAVSIFTKICEDSENDQDFVEITKITEEITTTQVQTDLSTTITTLEKMIKRRAAAGKIDDNYFAIVLTVAKRYNMLKQWSDAERVLREALSFAWAEFLEEGSSVKLPNQHAVWCVKIAVCFTHWHHMQGNTQATEATWARISESCRAVLGTTELKESENIMSSLLDFTDWRQNQSTIAKTFYQDILASYRNREDASTELIVTVLYRLANNSKDGATLYYKDIVKTLNTGRAYCHPGALKAAMELIKRFSDDEDWTNLRSTCEFLWSTFVHHNQEIAFKFTETEVQLIFDTYAFILENHSTNEQDLSTLQQISAEFRATTKAVFGADSDIYAMAMAALAKNCEAAGQYLEAAKVYEEIITEATTTRTNTETITEAKQRLCKIYFTIISDNGSAQIEANSLKRAVSYSEEVYDRVSTKSGVWHAEALHWLHVVIVLRQKLTANGQDGRVIELLKASFRGILTSDAKDLALYDAAKQLASSFSTARQETLGLDLAFQVRYQTVFGTNSDTSAKPSMDIDMASLHQSSFVFLVSFSQRLSKGAPGTFADLMAASRNEKSLYAKYIAATSSKEKGHIEHVLECGAKLRAFWIEQDQTGMVNILEEALFDLFKGIYAPIKTDEIYARSFFLKLLVQLQGQEKSDGTTDTDSDFGILVCQTGNTAVADLIEDKEFEQALGIAKFAFEFADSKEFYKDQLRVGYVYGLACLMAGISLSGNGKVLNKPTGALATQFVELSKKITARAMEIFKQIDIDLTLLNPQNRDGILRLLGHQKNYTQLEKYLDTLWASSRNQRPGNIPFILSIVRLRIRAHAGMDGGKRSASLNSAIRLCRDFSYNLSGSYGPLAEITVEVREMLASLYSTAGQFRMAEAIHQDIIRKVQVEAGGLQKRRISEERKACLVEISQRNLALLMYSRMRQKQSWAEVKKVLHGLDTTLKNSLGAQYTSSLSKHSLYLAGGVLKKDDQTGFYVASGGEEWRLDDGVDGDDKKKSENDYVGAAELIWGWVICNKHREVEGV